MGYFLGALILLGAAVWAHNRNPRDPDRAKAILIALLCAWWPATALAPAFADVRNWVYGLLVAVSVSWRPSRRTARWPAAATHPALLSLLVILPLSAAWAVRPSDSMMRAAGVLLAVLFMHNLVRTTDRSRIVAWLADGLLYASYATVATIILHPPGGETKMDFRYHINENVKATGAASLFLWAFLPLWYEAYSRQGASRVLHLSLAAMVLVAMLLTGTRGSLLALVVLLPILLAERSRPVQMARLFIRYPLYGAGVCAVGVLVWSHLGASVQADLAHRFRMDDTLEVRSDRFETWEGAVTKGMERPILGRGFGSSSFFQYSDDDDVSDLSYYATVHNQYVEVFYDFGIVGLVLFLWLLMALASSALSIVAGATGSASTAIRLLAVLALLGILEGFSHGGQLTTGNVWNTIRWLGICCVLGHYGVLQSRPVRRRRARGFLGAGPKPETRPQIARRTAGRHAARRMGSAGGASSAPVSKQAS